MSQIGGLCLLIYRIDEVAQRLLVYLHLHGGTSPREAVDLLGVEEGSEITTCMEEHLGPDAAGLVEEDSFTQATVSGDEQEVVRYQLTDEGEEFVYDHKSRLTMPADLAELAKKVAELQVTQDYLRTSVDDLEARLAEVEERLQNLD